MTRSILLFFFKQKTAYEMRISDWSSDVCSSDLAATGHGDVRAFLEWRLRHALSLSKAADALGVSRRMVAYYSNGEKKVPKPILLACRGWEASNGLYRAA